MAGPQDPDSNGRPTQPSPSSLRGEAAAARNAMDMVMTVAGTGVVLARVGIVVGLAMSLFLIAFLGYFVIPFIFVLLAMGILGLSGTLRAFTRLRPGREK